MFYTHPHPTPTPHTRLHTYTYTHANTSTNTHTRIHKKVYDYNAVQYGTVAYYSMQYNMLRWLISNAFSRCWWGGGFEFPPRPSAAIGCLSRQTDDFTNRRLETDPDSAAIVIAQDNCQWHSGNSLWLARHLQFQSGLTLSGAVAPGRGLGRRGISAKRHPFPHRRGAFDGSVDE